MKKQIDKLKLAIKNLENARPELVERVSTSRLSILDRSIDQVLKFSKEVVDRRKPVRVK